MGKSPPGTDDQVKVKENHEGSEPDRMVDIEQLQFIKNKSQTWGKVAGKFTSRLPLRNNGSYDRDSSDDDKKNNR